MVAVGDKFLEDDAPVDLRVVLTHPPVALVREVDPVVDVGEVILWADEDELASARWMSREELRPENLPKDGSFFMPRRDSIARRLIADWLAG